MKEILICDKSYKIDANAYTYVEYKNIFKRGIFTDIQIIKIFFAKQAEEIKLLKEKGIQEKDLEIELQKGLLNYVDDFIGAITRLAYIFIYTADNTIKDYEDFLKEIPKLSIDDEWVIEVTEFAVDKFC